MTARGDSSVGPAGTPGTTEGEGADPVSHNISFATLARRKLVHGQQPRSFNPARVRNVSDGGYKFTEGGCCVA
jgi:hypothetical protein